MSAGVVYVISGCEDVVLVMDLVNDKFNVVGVTPGSIWGKELPAITVMVRNGAVEDSKALWGGVVLAELSNVQISVKGVRFWSRGACVNIDGLRGQGRRRRQRRRGLRGLRGSRAQTVAEGERSGGAFDTVDEGRGSSHSAEGDGGESGEVAYGGRMVFMEVLDELISMNVKGGFPAIVSFGETLPPDQVL